jgi:hypothetical protein
MAKNDPADERTPYEIARERLEQNRKAAMRGSRMHSKPISTMPATSTGTHGLYTQLASLQMSKARQEKIREALLEQIARCEDEIARVDVETARIKQRIDLMDARSSTGRAVPRTGPSGSASPKDETSESLEEAFRFKY